MNCHDAETLLLAERDGALNDEERAVLASHLADCASCARLRESLTAAAGHFRETTLSVAVPDAAGEWREIRERVAAPPPLAPVWPRLMPAIGVSLAAAAAFAIAFFAEPQWFGREQQPPVEAQAEFVEVPGSNATPVVYVDESSGWLVVWAVDTSKAVGS